MACIPKKKPTGPNGLKRVRINLFVIEYCEVGSVFFILSGMIFWDVILDDVTIFLD